MSNCNNISCPFNKNLLNILCILTFLCFYQITFAVLNNTPIKLNHFSAINKLPGQSIQCIHQDSLGILWLGIESVGLTKYDGKRTTIYQNIPADTTSLSTNYPVQIISDYHDQIWVATSNGLNRLNRKTGKITRYFSAPENPATISHNTLHDIKHDTYGNLWIASQNGVSIYNPEKDEFVRILHNKDYNYPANHNEISSIHIDADQNIWIASILNGLTKFSSSNVSKMHHYWNSHTTNEAIKEIYNILEPESHLKTGSLPPVRSINSNHPDTIWLATQNGLYYYHYKSNLLKKYKFCSSEHSFLVNVTYLSLKFDSNNLLWAGTANDGLVIINRSNNTVQHLDASNYINNELKSNSIREILEGNCGLIWISTKFGGLHYYDSRQQTFPVIRKSDKAGEGLSDEFVLSIYADNSAIWIGTKGGGLNKLDLKTNTYTYFTNDGQPGSLKSNRVESITRDNKGTLWVGTEAGLFSKNEKSNTFEHRDSTHIRTLAIIKDYLWLGTSNGIFRYSIKENRLAPLSTRHNSFFDTQSNTYIIEIFEDSSGTIWIATQATGLFEYQPDSDNLVHHTHHPKSQNSISGNQVRAIYEDSKNRLWIGTKSDGLNIFNRETRSFTTLSSSDVLPSNTIYHILEDKSGKLWMGTHSGISNYDPETGKFLNFPPAYGAQSYVFEVNAHAKTTDGILLMGGNNGLNMFAPELIQVSIYQAPIIISDFKIFNESIATDISNTKEFTLSHKSNYFSFEFALLDYTDPDENRYSYILEPFDEDWIYADSRNFATYTNLNPGKYTFKVKGIKSDGTSSTQPLELNLTIPAPFWKTKWFIPLLGFLIVSIIVLAYYLKILAGKKREATLKAEVEQRTKDLSDAYKKLEESNLQIEKHNIALRQQRDRISRQNLELKIHRQNLELMVADRTKDLEKAKIKAEESDRLKSAFLANMSHEIRTPLNAIMGFIDLLEAEEFKKEEKKYISSIIQTNSNALLQLINDIIDISMIEANQLIIKRERINFDKFINDIHYHYSVKGDHINSKVTINLQTPNNPEPLFIWTDPGRTRQIFTNLLNNAIKFTTEGSIALGYYKDESKQEIICFVKDTGIGISADNVKLLFERFMKIEPSSLKVHRGTGLGLSISKHLCELLDGKIWVDSQLEKGTTFYFSLPNRVRSLDF